MKTVKLALIGFQALVLSFGMAVFLCGCGGGEGSGAGGEVTPEDQMKQVQNASGAMEAAGKAQKSQPRKK